MKVHHGMFVISYIIVALSIDFYECSSLYGLNNILKQASTHENPDVSHMNKGPTSADCSYVNLFLRQLVDEPLPDAKGATETSYGTLNYDITNLKISSIGNVSCKARVIDIGSMQLMISNGSTNLLGDWTIELDSMHSSGEMSAIGSGMRIDLNASVTFESGSLKRNIECKTNIDHLHITLHGGSAWFYQPFVNHFSPTVKQQAESLVCKKLAQKWKTAF